MLKNQLRIEIFITFQSLNAVLSDFLGSSEVRMGISLPHLSRVALQSQRPGI